MGFGGSSLGYCGPPFSAHLPTPTTATSSSTLSPLAPPFTVDRVAPRPGLPYDPYISPWPPRSQSSEDCLHRPPSPSPPPSSPPRPDRGATTAAADALPYYGHGHPPVVPDLASASSGEASSRRNPKLAPADPYYPRFNSAAVTSVGDAPAFYGGCREGSVTGSGYLGRRAAVSNAPFGMGTQAEGIGRSSSWMERENTAVAPGYGVAFQQGTPADKDVPCPLPGWPRSDASTAPGFLAYEDLLGGWHGKLTESPSGKDRFKYEHLNWLDGGTSAGVPSDLSGTSALSPSAPVGVHYPHLSDMHTFVEGSKTSDFNSSYDKYVCQANTDRTDPRAFYPATTYFAANILASTSSTSTSMDKCSLKNVNHVQHVNAYKSDMLHRGRVSIRPKEPGIDLNFEDKEDYARMNREEDMRKIDNANVNSSVVKIALPPSIELAKQISQDYSLGKKSELRIAKLNIPGSVECDHEQSSSERLDENLAEDSPCWKGAPSSRHSVSNTFDTLVADCALADQKFDSPHKRGSDYPKVENKDVALHSHDLRKDMNIVMLSKDHRDDFESKNENIVQAVNEEKSSMSAKDELVTGTANHCSDRTQDDSSSLCSLANDQLSLALKAVTDASNGRIKPPVISDPSFRSSMLGIDAQVLVKTIHNLSELLLSSCRFDANLLEEHDMELLWYAINNLDMCISSKPESGRMRSELFCRSGRHHHRQLSALSEDVPKGRCQATGSESIDRSVEQSNNRSTCSVEKVHSISSNVGGDKLVNFFSTCGDKNLKKLSGKVMNEKIYEQGENPQAPFYENLWFDVEDAVHLLKYRLQLLRSNIVKDNCKHQLTKDAEWEASNMLKLSSQNYKNAVMGESMRAWKSTDSLSKNPSAQGKHENVNNMEKPLQTISSSIDSKVDDIDASAMARFKVLKHRIDKLSSVNVEEQHGQLNSLNVVSNSGIHENICSPCLPDGKLNSGLKFQPANDAMPAVWGFQQSFHRGGTEGEGSGRNSVQHHVADCTEDLCLNSHFSEHRMSDGICVQGAGGLANPSYVPDSRSGKHFTTGAHDGSSDWEHVLEEELTW